MAYARVTMAEFDSRAKMHGAIEELGKNMKSVFPEILMFAAMETAENSQLTISVYADKDAADRAVTQRVEAMKGTGVADLFTHEGNVNNFYLDNSQLALLLSAAPKKSKEV
jgi:hypothetical protein